MRQRVKDRETRLNERCQKNISYCMKKTPTVFRERVPADDEVVIKQVSFDVLYPDGLVEALWDQEPEQPSQVRGMVQRHTHLTAVLLQQRQQHGPRVSLT